MIKIGLLIIIIISLFVLTGCWYMMEREPHIFDQKKYIEEENRLIKESREKRSQYILSHPELSERQKLLIENGSIAEDLTKEQVKLIKIIVPNEIRKGNTYDFTEIWIYTQGLIEEQIYFKDNVVVRVEHIKNSSEKRDTLHNLLK